MDAAALTCQICPRRPHFSDVSHLLTHVASKAHLANYFKLQVQSHQDSAAREILTRYNEWYEAYNLAKLLSDRMSSKGSRRRRSSARVAVKNQTATEPADHQPQSVNSCIDEAAHLPADIHSNIDPRLYRSGPLPDKISDKIVDAGGTAASPVSSASARSIVKVQPHPWKSEAAGDDDAGYSNLLYSTPMFQSRTNRSALHQTSPKAESSHLGDAYFEFVDGDKAEEMRLKGIQWPGMNIFDSATAVMKKQRNQKKHDNVLRLMEKTSEDIEPTEMIFSPTGILRKEREITGMVDDDSPLKGEMPVPKRRCIRPSRAPLSTSNPNRTIVKGSRAKKGHCQSAEALVGLSRQALPVTGSPSDSQLFVNSHGYGYAVDDHQDEFKLALEGYDDNAGSSFQIFRDDEQHVFGMDADYFPDARQTTPTPRGGSLSRQYETREAVIYEQENLAPVYKQPAHFHAGSDLGQLIDTPPRDDHAVYVTDNSTANTHRLHYGAFTRGNVTSLRYNPLTLSRPYHPPPHDNSGRAAVTYGNRSKSRGASPDATVSDIEVENRAAMYFD
jgi:hypothetical protein